MNNQTNKTAFIFGTHFLILLSVYITTGLLYYFYIVYFKVDIPSGVTFYDRTLVMLLVSYSLSKLFMITKENNSSFFTIMITLVLYIFIYGILSPLEMIVSFLQYNIENYAFLHTSIIIIIIEKLGRMYISKRLNKKEII